MNNEALLIIMPAKWEDYYRFRPLCCVENLPYMRGQCWTLGLMAEGERGWENADIGFVGYNWPYRYNAVREAALKKIKEMSGLTRSTWYKTNLRALSRIMIRPEYRGRHYAEYLIKNTVMLVDVPYIECVTFTERIANILEKCGFKNYGKTGGIGCDYYLLKK